VCGVWGVCDVCGVYGPSVPVPGEGKEVWRLASGRLNPGRLERCNGLLLIIFTGVVDGAIDDTCGDGGADSMRGLAFVPDVDVGIDGEEEAVENAAAVAAASARKISDTAGLGVRVLTGEGGIEEPDEALPKPLGELELGPVRPLMLLPKEADRGEPFGRGRFELDPVGDGVFDEPGERRGSGKSSSSSSSLIVAGGGPRCAAEEELMMVDGMMPPNGPGWV
jgi:hypothetical protein